MPRSTNINDLKKRHAQRRKKTSTKKGYDLLGQGKKIVESSRKAATKATQQSPEYYNTLDLVPLAKRVEFLTNAAQNNDIIKVNVDEIKFKDNVRQTLDDSSDEFLQLKDSIERMGVLQSISLRLIIRGSRYELVCIAGHRRVSAVKQVGKDKQIPAKIIVSKKDKETLLYAMAENLNREDLHFLDIADGYKQLLDSLILTKAGIAKYFDRSEQTVSSYLKMGGWNQELKDFIRKNSDQLSYRVVANKFAKRKFFNDRELLKALKDYLKASNQDPVVKKKARVQKNKALIEDYFTRHKSSNLSEWIDALQFVTRYKLIIL